MAEQEIREPWREIQTFVLEGEAKKLQAFLDVLSPSEVARALTRLDEEQQQKLLTLLEPEEAADLIEELSDIQGADLIEDLPAGQAAAIVDEMESDHRADLLGEMDEDDAEQILRRMNPEEALDARRLLEYDENTAGGVMVTEFVVYPQDATVGDILQDMREHPERFSDLGVQYVYIESHKHTLVGVLRLRDLILSPPHTPARRVMTPNPVYVIDQAPLDELEDLFDRYPFFMVPVTNENGRLIGVVRRADMEEALGEEHERALLRFSGIIGGEELRSMPVLERAPRRLVWLGFNVILSITAASVILMFEHTISRVFALVFFIPVIANLSGCSGNQAVAVSIRELTLGVIEPSDFLRVWAKEFWVGLINGAVLGTVLGCIAFAMDHFLWHGSPYLGLVVGIAFVMNSLVAVSLGGVIPLLLKTMKADPALGAPPILTTLTDMFGFLFVLGLATAALYVGWI